MLLILEFCVTFNGVEMKRGTYLKADLG